MRTGALLSQSRSDNIAGALQASALAPCLAFLHFATAVPCACWAVYSTSRVWGCHANRRRGCYRPGLRTNTHMYTSSTGPRQPETSACGPSGCAKACHATEGYLLLQPHSCQHLVTEGQVQRRVLSTPDCRLQRYHFRFPSISKLQTLLKNIPAPWFLLSFNLKASIPG
jgi:hypothetical protein